MNNTKHDLSANAAKLNLNDLITLAQSAAGLAKVECERELGELQRILAYVQGEKQKYNGAKYAANRLAHVAKHAAMAFETLHYLVEAKDREDIKVINPSAK